MNPVVYAYDTGIMTGTSATTFSPNTAMNRAMVAQILYNLEGQPTVTGESTFTDSNTHWAAKAIAWAQKTGVVSGYGNNTFRPNQAVTREELAQMLYNYAEYKQYDLTASGDLIAFPDGNNVQGWAKTAMSWANGSGLINGHDDGTDRPPGHHHPCPGCQHPHELRPERRGKLKQNPGAGAIPAPFARPGKSTRCHFPGNPQAMGRPTHRRRGAKSALQNHSPGKTPATVNRPRLCGQ